MPLQCGRCLCHLHQGNDSLLHSRPAGTAEQDDRKLFLRCPLHCPCDFLADHMSHAAHEKSCITDAKHGLLAINFTFSYRHCLVKSGLFPDCLKLLLIFWEFQRILVLEIFEPRLERPGICHHADSVFCTDSEVVSTLIAHITVLFHLCAVDLLLT